jgi:hypothetical protein
MRPWCCSSSAFRKAASVPPLPPFDAHAVVFTHMNVILLESALFIALVVVVGAFVVKALGLTPAGLRLKQAANRKRIERQAALTCPIHGLQREEEMVRLPTGEPLCPQCYKEAVHDHST